MSFRCQFTMGSQQNCTKKCGCCIGTERLFVGATTTTTCWNDAWWIDWCYSFGSVHYQRMSNNEPFGDTQCGTAGDWKPIIQTKMEITDMGSNDKSAYRLETSISSTRRLYRRNGKTMVSIRTSWGIWFIELKTRLGQGIPYWDTQPKLPIPPRTLSWYVTKRSDSMRDYQNTEESSNQFYIVVDVGSLKPR